MIDKGDMKVPIAELATIIRPALSEGRAVRFIVTGTSMYPLLVPERDSVILERADKLKKRDIAFYERRDGSFILHRIIKINKKGIWCVGDNQTIVEGPLKREQILGVVTSIIRQGREFSVKSFRYRAYAFLWTLVRPFRRLAYRVYHRLKRIFRRK